MAEVSRYSGKGEAIHQAAYRTDDDHFGGSMIAQWVKCALGYHDWKFTGFLKCCGFDHHAKCVHCGIETWMDEAEYQRKLRGAP